MRASPLLASILSWRRDKLASLREPSERSGSASGPKPERRARVRDAGGKASGLTIEIMHAFHRRRFQYIFGRECLSMLRIISAPCSVILHATGELNACIATNEYNVRSRECNE